MKINEEDSEEYKGFTIYNVNGTWRVSLIKNISNDLLIKLDAHESPLQYKTFISLLEDLKKEFGYL